MGCYALRSALFPKCCSASCFCKLLRQREGIHRAILGGMFRRWGRTRQFVLFQFAVIVFALRRSIAPWVFASLASNVLCPRCFVWSHAVSCREKRPRAFSNERIVRTVRFAKDEHGEMFVSSFFSFKKESFVFAGCLVWLAGVLRDGNRID